MIDTPSIQPESPLSEEDILMITNTCKENGMSDEEIELFLIDPEVIEVVEGYNERRRISLQKIQELLGMEEVISNNGRVNERFKQDAISQLLLSFIRRNQLHQQLAQ